MKVLAHSRSIAAIALLTFCGAASAADTVSTVNPYGLGALWENGDLVARGTLLLLAIMSMGSWYVIITKLFEQAKLQRQWRDAKRQFWAAKSPKAGLESLPAGTPFHYLADNGLKASETHHTGPDSKVDYDTWVTSGLNRAIDKIQSRTQGGLAFLGTVGSTSPFVGLFGTVWGIYHALTAIGIAGQASIDKVAGPVGEALIMTSIGLAVAVPAVLCYNWLVRRNKGVMERVREFGADLHDVLLGGPAPSQLTSNKSVQSTATAAKGA